MEKASHKIGEFLVRLGHSTGKDIERALEIQKADGQGRRLGRILVEEFALTEDALLEALSEQFSIPVMNTTQMPESMPVDRLSYEFLINNVILPLSFDGSLMEIAIADPIAAAPEIGSLRASFDCDVKAYLATSEDIVNRLEALHASKSAVMKRLIDDVTDDSLPLHDADSEEASHLKDLAQEKGIIQLANLVIENAVKENSSDIHIEPTEDSVRVRYRIDGILYEREVLPAKTKAALISRIKLLSKMNIAEHRLPQDGRIRGRFLGKEIDIRVSTIPTIFGESVVMRLLDKNTAFISLEETGFEDELLEKYEDLIRRPYGMILMTGPTGSGKSTSLYASLDRINTTDKKIITVEDPVEYLIKGINQIQVKPSIGLDFAGGLRHIVRQDPDVIMVGEIRDKETAAIAVHAALTGHLLFSTLHTNDSPSAITRLTEMGVEHFLVSSTLLGIIAQRLVRRICQDCKEQYTVPDDVRKSLGIGQRVLYKGKGCPRCMNTGYRGRTGIYEMLTMDDNIRELINQKATARKIREAASAADMKTLRQDGIDKAIRGITTLDEVLRVTQTGF